MSVCVEAEVEGAELEEGELEVELSCAGVESELHGDSISAEEVDGVSAAPVSAEVEVEPSGVEPEGSPSRRSPYPAAARDVV